MAATEATGGGEGPRAAAARAAAVVIFGEAPDMSSVVEDVRHRWSSPSIDTTPREAHAKKQGPDDARKAVQIGFVSSETSAALGLNGSRSPAISSSILAALSFSPLSLPFSIYYMYVTHHPQPASRTPTRWCNRLTVTAKPPSIDRSVSF